MAGFRSSVSRGTDSGSGQTVDGGIEAQTRQALLNLDAILKTASSGLENLLHTTCFLARASDFAAFERTYRELVTAPPPALATVGVELMVEGALVEIQAIAATATKP
jgi:2-iminobutanoate/2-iminopropanoate deaminase